MKILFFENFENFYFFEFFVFFENVFFAMCVFFCAMCVCFLCNVCVFLCDVCVCVFCAMCVFFLSFFAMSVCVFVKWRFPIVDRVRSRYQSVSRKRQATWMTWG